MWKWLVWALAGCVGQAATLRGAIVDNQSGRPLARSLVVIQPVAGTSGVTQSVRANSYGAFEFQSLAAGAYLVTASRRGFAPVQYGQKRWKASGVPVVLEATTTAQLGSIRLPRYGGLSGTVSDEADVGMPGIQVAIYRNTRPPRLVKAAETDDRGMYRLGGLEPGSYLVRTHAGQDIDGSYLPTFAPETTQIDGARPADVTLDRETTHVNLRPIPGRLYTVAGSVRGVPRGGVTLMLTSDMGTETTAADNAGNFHFKPVAPGQYELAAISSGDGRSGVRAAWMPLHVERDRDYLVALNPVAAVRFFVEDSNGQAIQTETVSIVARRRDLSGEVRPSVLRLDSGVAAMPPGRWELSLTPGPDQYVSGFAWPSSNPATRRADGWNEIVVDGQGPVAVRFVLASNPGSLHGVVAGAPGAPVFLEAVDPESRRRLVTLRTTRTDVRGRYQFNGLAPGHYRIVSSYELDEPDSAAMNAASQKIFRIEAGQIVAADLELYSIP